MTIIHDQKEKEIKKKEVTIPKIPEIENIQVFILSLHINIMIFL